MPDLRVPPLGVGRQQVAGELLTHVAEAIYGLVRMTGESDVELRARIVAMIGHAPSAREMTLADMTRIGVPLRPTSWQRLLKDEEDDR